MKMNLMEKIAMNNPIRALIQRRVEMPLLKKLGGKLEGLKILEIGCGRGIGTQLIFDQLGADQVIATDFDTSMLDKARARLSHIYPSKLTFQTADATQLNFEDDEFDAVVNFAAIHHIPHWQKAIAEIHRVLKPQGKFYFQEVTKQWICRWPYRALFKHPMENRFSSQQFINELEIKGFNIQNKWVEKSKGDFLFGVARLSNHPSINVNQTLN